ncbi:hypothetical protein AD998_17920 [bacterium 336/3]|nr:hypothetical protein AD998_17920 [bacterium 336/3]
MKYFWMVKLVNKQTFLFVFFVLLIRCGYSQNPLEEPISIKVQDEKLSNVLKNIALQSNISFSYNPANIEDKTIAFQSNKQPLRIVLNQILPQNISYKVKGKYLILEKKTIREIKKPKYFTLAGYVVDSRSGRRIEGVSIYEKTTFVSSVSNQFGYYEMRLPTQPTYFTIYIQKDGYQKEEMTISTQKLGLVNIALTLNLEEKPLKNNISNIDFLPIPDTLNIQPIPDSLNKPSYSLRHRLFRTKSTIFVKTSQFFTSTIQEIHLRNLDTTLSKEFQVSFLPTISTNRFLGGNTVTKYSFNVLIGYNEGVKRFELGGIMNLNAQDVGYVQIGGVGNVVGGGVYGVQIGGIFNRVGKDVNGIQIGGLFNIVSNDLKGFQTASIYSWTRKNAFGGQVSGLLNRTRNLDGVQVTAGLNIIANNINGAQVSGFGNIVSQNMKGVQVSSTFNWVNKNITGVQVSGFLNYAKKIKEGIQFSGFLNITKKAEKAVQLGIVNIATDSTKDFIPIGLLSFVKNGYKRLEISIDEQSNYTTSFKSGVSGFYNVLMMGTNALSKSENIIGGYGIGTSISATKRLNVDFQTVGSQIINLNKEVFFQNLQIRLSANAEYHFFKHWSVFGGTSLNIWLSQDKNNFLEFYPKLPTTLLKENAQNDVYKANWIGFQGGIRFGW